MINPKAKERKQSSVATLISDENLDTRKKTKQKRPVGKVLKNFLVDEVLFEEFVLLCSVRGKPYAHVLGDLISDEVEANEELLRQIKAVKK